LPLLKFQPSYVPAQQSVGLRVQTGLYREQQGYSAGVFFVTAVWTDWKESNVGRFDKGWKITEGKIPVSKRPVLKAGFQKTPSAAHT